MPAVTVSGRLALSLRALGAAGEAWLAGLPGLLAGLEADWSVTVGARLDGGHAAYVAEAVTRDGTPAVLKVPVPPGAGGFTPFGRQLAALRLAGGDPYARLIRHDVPRRALLLERLGRPMASLGWPAARQMDALARTAARGWRPVPDDGQLPTGAEAARWLAGFISSAWEELARPCPEAAVDLAVRCAAAREAAFDPDRAVLVHGDVHAFNALQVPGSPAGAFRLVDAEGLISEPAHDLGVIIVRGVQGRPASSRPPARGRRLRRWPGTAGAPPGGPGPTRRPSGSGRSPNWSPQGCSCCASAATRKRERSSQRPASWRQPPRTASRAGHGRQAPGRRNGYRATPAWRPCRTPPAPAEVRPAP